jgi:cytochrome b561
MPPTQEPSRSFESAGRYGAAAIAFHWLMFILVVGVGVLGLLHDSWPKRTQGFWINIHALAGLGLWFTLIARLGWRWRHAPPTPMENMGAISRRLSGAVHFGLYALLLITPIIGIVTFVYHGRAFEFGFFRVDFGIRSNRSVFHPTEDWHGYLAYGLFGVAGLHAVAALWHQFVLRDGLISRMWPRA